MSDVSFELSNAQISFVKAQTQKEIAEAVKLDIETKQLSDPWQRTLNVVKLASASTVAVVGIVAGAYGLLTGSERAELAIDRLKHVKEVTKVEQEKLKAIQIDLAMKSATIIEKDKELSDLDDKARELLKTNRQEIEKEKRESQALLRKLKQDIEHAKNRLAQMSRSIPTNATTVSTKSQVQNILGQLNSVTVAASKGIQSTNNSEDLDLMDLAVRDLYSTKSNDRLRGYETITKKFRSHKDIVSKLLDMARRNSENANGIYNTAVTLNHISRTVTRPAIEQIKTFCRSAKSTANKTIDRCDKLIEWISK